MCPSPGHCRLLWGSARNPRAYDPSSWGLYSYSQPWGEANKQIVFACNKM